MGRAEGRAEGRATGEAHCIRGSVPLYTRVDPTHYAVSGELGVPVVHPRTHGLLREVAWVSPCLENGSKLKILFILELMTTAFPTTRTGIWLFFCFSFNSILLHRNVYSGQKIS